MRKQKKSKPESELPLAGVRVLVGRARHQAGALSGKLRKLGANVIEIPFIEIRKPRSFKPLDSALGHLDTYDWLILTSVNGVDAMWERLGKLKLNFKTLPGQQIVREEREFTRAVEDTKMNAALAAEGSNSTRLCIAAIGPATRKAIERRGVKVDVVPKEYIAESVVQSLRRRVRGKRILLVRAKVARDVIPNELRRAGAHVDVAEAYETVVPQSSRVRLRAALDNPLRRPHVATFTSSSTVRNFVALLGSRKPNLEGMRLASIGPVTSSTLREFGFCADIAAKEFTIPGLVKAIAIAMSADRK
jgi:uroporphyrinogen-III synthase